MMQAVNSHTVYSYFASFGFKSLPYILLSRHCLGWCSWCARHRQAACSLPTLTSSTLFHPSWWWRGSMMVSVDMLLNEISSSSIVDISKLSCCSSSKHWFTPQEMYVQNCWKLFLWPDTRLNFVFRAYTTAYLVMQQVAILWLGI